MDRGVTTSRPGVVGSPGPPSGLAVLPSALWVPGLCRSEAATMPTRRTSTAAAMPAFHRVAQRGHAPARAGGRTTVSDVWSFFSLGTARATGTGYELARDADSSAAGNTA